MLPFTIIFTDGSHKVTLAASEADVARALRIKFNKDVAVFIIPGRHAPQWVDSIIAAQPS